MDSNKKVLAKFLVALHNSNGKGKLAHEIAEEVGLNKPVFDKLMKDGWLQQTSFGTPDYRVADPILKKLGLNPHQ